MWEECRSVPWRGRDCLGSFSKKYEFAMETGGNSIPDGAQHMHTQRVGPAPIPDASEASEQEHRR